MAIDDLYRPEDAPEDSDLTSSTRVRSADPERRFSDEEKADAAKRIDKRFHRIRTEGISGGSKRPLDRAEVEELRRRADQARLQIAATRSRIEEIGNYIDETVAGSGRPDLAFTVNTKGKPHLKRAIKKAFNTDGKRLTYAMYREALQTKASLEQSQTSDYVNGNWDEE